MQAAPSSRPHYKGFRPVLAHQAETLRIIRDFDYAQGTLEILLSGALGSAKSITVAHIVVRHCLRWPRARAGIGRRSLPDLRDTLFKEILEHIERDYVEGRDYWVNYTRLSIRFWNGSEIEPMHWADGRYKRARSKKLSLLAVEELTENDESDKEGFEEAKARVGRLAHVPENIVICATNPDDPAHWVYRYFIEPRDHPTRRVVHSRTADNTFLRDSYEPQLLRDLDEKRAKQLVRGEWISLGTGRVYYAYGEHNRKPKIQYQHHPGIPIRLSWDFNIGEGKPLSMVCFQRLPDGFHFFHEVVVEGIRTEDSLEELANRGILDLPCPHFIINGDASGKHRDTRNKRSDYDIITEYLARYRTKDGRPLNFIKQVPLSNPAIKERHNKINAWCRNAIGQVRIFVYDQCTMLDRGLRLVSLKAGGQYIEDDSKDYQHVTTAAGYGVMASLQYDDRPQQSTREL